MLEVTIKLDTPYNQSAAKAKTVEMSIKTATYGEPGATMTIKLSMQDAVDLTKNLLTALREYKTAQAAEIGGLFDDSLKDLAAI